MARSWIGFKTRFGILALAFLSPWLVEAHAEVETLQPAEGKEAMLFQEIPSVYGASKYEQKVTEAPAAVTIVTASEISRYGYRTLADILRSVRGVYTSYDRNYDYIGFRGFARPGDYNTRFLLRGRHSNQ